MYHVHTFDSTGHHRLGSLATLIIPDLKTLAGVINRVYAAKWLDTTRGFEVEKIHENQPHVTGEMVFRSCRARRLFGERIDSCEL